MKSVFLIAAFNALFFTVLLFQKKPKALHDIILIFWLTYLGLFIGVYAIYSHELFTHFRLLSVSLISLLMLHGPFLYYYLSALISGKKKFEGGDLLHLIPFALFNLYIIVSSQDPSLAEKLNLERVSPGDDPPLLFTLFLIITVLSGPVYFMLTFSLFKKLDLKIFRNFSNPENVDLLWIRKLVIVFGLVWTSLVIITVIHHIFDLFPAEFCTDGLFLTLSFFVIVIGYYGLKQNVIFAVDVAPADDIKMQAKYSGSRLTGEEAKQYAARLKEYMASARPYLNPDLSLPQLAAELNISSHYLSQVINDQFSLNFFDFVNSYRVGEVKQRISDPDYDKFSLLGIAMECGFNSKSAFNRVFRQMTGMTPSAYRNAPASPRGTTL